jgi:hypothetical protein
MFMLRTGLLPSSSLVTPLAGELALSSQELDAKSAKCTRSVEEILEQEQKDAEQRERWYEQVMNSPDEPQDIRELCIEMMQLEHALDQFGLWL